MANQAACDIIDNLLKTETPQTVIEFVQTNHYTSVLSQTILGKLLVAYINVVGWEDEENKISPTIQLEDLYAINESFRTKNGCTWVRDRTWLHNTYAIEKTRTTIKLVGESTSLKNGRDIRSDIDKQIKKQRCVVLDVHNQIETDHKNGRYDDPRVMNKETQVLDDFQPMHKNVNDAKRHHCDRCVKEKKRYDATRLGYKEGWTEGDENDTICEGCYWYDPKQFNQTISKDFVKEDKKDKDDIV